MQDNSDEKNKGSYCACANKGKCYVPCLSPSGTPSDTALTPPDLRTCLRIDTYILVPIPFPFPFRSSPGPIWLSKRLP
ncbi:hypothetical protein BD311DRAFT_826213 [Dichomitus squalens]|uniref:Uncharacterized protein n=1 Tax=Dichomitus squalens TaxID=114155 RepID=A0A4Q9M833_9APHY|nr:hypothetical protein BD311DRAFT_826213 [Dichomitus squalens]